MFKDTKNGMTHCVCNNRLKKEGGKAKCCECEPHDDCNLGQAEPTPTSLDSFIKETGTLRVTKFHCSEHSYINPIPKCPECVDKEDAWGNDRAIKWENTPNDYEKATAYFKAGYEKGKEEGYNAGLISHDDAIAEGIRLGKESEKARIIGEIEESYKFVHLDNDNAKLVALIEEIKRIIKSPTN